MSDDILDRYSRGNQPAPIADGSFTPTDIFSKYDRGADAPAASAASTPSWQEAEALENLAAQGAKPAPAEPKKEGRGIARALIDYPGHLLSGLADTVAAPGNVLAATTPQTSESMIPGALGVAGLVGGTEFPRVGGAALATKGATAIAEKVAPSSQAVNKLVDAIEPQNVTAVVNRLREDPTLTLADASPTVRQLSQGLIDPAQPKATNAIVSAVQDRIAARKGDVEHAFTQAMGESPNVPAMVEGLKERARVAGREAIQPALENAKLVDTSPVIKAIDEKLEPGVNPLLSQKSELPLSAEQEALARVKQQLISGSGEQLFDAQRLHRVQSDIGDQAYQLSKSPDPKDRLLGTQLRSMNEKLIDQIDEATGGTYRPARAKFKDAKDVSEAFESGFDTLKNRPGLSGAMEDSPDAFANWMKTASPEEVVARRLGTRADIDQKINSVKNGALRGETITKIPYNQEKLKMLFGENEANRLIRLMENSSDKSATNAAILGGSHTARIQAGQKALAVPEVGGKRGVPLQTLGTIAGLAEGASYLAAPFLGGYLPGLAGAAAGVGRGIGWAASRGVQKGMQLNALARNSEFAKRSLATGPAREQTINALLSHPKVVREFKKRANALTAP